MHNSSQQYHVHTKLQVSTEGSGKPGLKGTRSPSIMELIDKQNQIAAPNEYNSGGGC
jgi:hypothetical protein